MALDRRHSLATVGGSVLALVLAAAGALSSHVVPHIAGFDWASWATQLVSVVLPSLAIVVTFYARQLVTVLPKWILPIAAVVFATFGDQLASWVSTHQANPLLAAAAGALGSLCYIIAKEWVGDQA